MGYGLTRLLILGLAATAVTPASAAAWRDASATLPPKEAPGLTMNAKAADMDGDGDIDLVTAQEHRANRLLLNDGKGRFTDMSLNLPRVRRDSEEIALLDIDQDGDLDIAVANEDDIRPELYLNQGGAKFTEASDRLSIRIKANAVVALDADQDGFSDLFFGGNAVSILMMGDGKGGFRDESLTRLPNTSGATQDVAVGDIDKDGDPDLVLGNEDRNQIYLNDGKGVFTLPANSRIARPPAGEETRDVELFDVDQDGDLDVHFSNVKMSNPGAVPISRLLLNDGAGVFTDAPDSRFGPWPEALSMTALPLDVDQDGRVDLITGAVTANLVGPDFEGTLRVLKNTADGLKEVSAQMLPTGLKPNPIDITSADFDGDGKADLFISQFLAPDILLLSGKAG